MHKGWMFYLSILIFRGISLQRSLCPSTTDTPWTFNPHFQRHFTATLWHTATRPAMPTFNPHFQRHFTATKMLGKTSSIEERFQSSFSEAFHCNVMTPPKPTVMHPFNPHFQRHFTATPKRARARLEAPMLSILIFRGISLQLHGGDPLRLPAVSFNPHFQRHFTATPCRGEA